MVAVLRPSNPTLPTSPTTPFAEEIDHFLGCIEAGVESHASIHDSAMSMALVFAIEESLAAGGEPVAVSP